MTGVGGHRGIGPGRMAAGNPGWPEGPGVPDRGPGAG